MSGVCIEYREKEREIKMLNIQGYSYGRRGLPMEDRIIKNGNIYFLF